MKTVFTNGRIILADRILDGYSVIVEDGVISDVTRGNTAADKVVDLGGRYLAPGFIDMHTHGAGGHDFMDGTEEAIKGACMTHLSHGTTSIVPTTLTCLNSELFNFFEVFRKVKTGWHEGPNLLGIHLEGPFFNAAQAGAQDPKFLQLPTRENFMPILEAGGADIMRISVAVELEGALELGEELKKRGVIAAIGHSDATYAEVAKAVKAGYSFVTHLYSGMSALHRVGPYRVLGVVESAYLFDELGVEIISDGKHLPPELLRLIVKNKGIDNICLITDSMRGAGMPEGSRPKLGSLTNGQETLIRDGVAMMPDLKAFAGSVCTTDRCVRTMYKLACVSLPDAVRMMTANPARVLGIDGSKGTIAKGMDADLVVFDEDINISSVYVGGEPRYTAE
ncbi:MAG: N-acetylglucosamine-6-phosphate deacetylase [Candidatus Limivicinus sp.]|nr:N-acetylglucosamine-6-phosphate deacetylase [Candidatus Limivicinus sp.]